MGSKRNVTYSYNMHKGELEIFVAKSFDLLGLYMRVWQAIIPR